MALALTNVVKHSAGDLTAVHATLTYSSTYSGSATVTAAQLGLSLIDNVQGCSEGGYIFSPVLATKPSAVSFIPKLFTGATPTEASGTVAEVVELRVLGR